ncbi:hypothetical protein ISCGN_006353, partial [Ixodes scapularis]
MMEHSRIFLLQILFLTTAGDFDEYVLGALERVRNATGPAFHESARGNQQFPQPILVDLQFERWQHWSSPTITSPLQKPAYHASHLGHDATSMMEHSRIFLLQILFLTTAGDFDEYVLGALERVRNATGPAFHESARENQQFPQPILVDLQFERWQHWSSPTITGPLQKPAYHAGHLGHDATSMMEHSRIFLLQVSYLETSKSKNSFVLVVSCPNDW